MRARSLGAALIGRHHRSLAAVLVLAASLVCVALLVAPPAAFAGWPDDPDMYPFYFGGGIGAQTGWANGQPDTFTNTLISTVSVVDYGGQAVTYYADGGNLNYQAWDVQTDQSYTGPGPTQVGGVGTAICEDPSCTYGFLGACSTGDDVYVFFCVNPLSSPSTLVWVQASEAYGQWHTETATWLKSVAWSDGLQGLAAGQYVMDAGAGNAGVVALDDAFAFVYLANGDADTFWVTVDNLSGEANSQQTTGYDPGSDSGSAAADSTVECVTAIPFFYDNETWLAVGAVFGDTPSTDMQGAVYLMQPSNPGNGQPESLGGQQHTFFALDPGYAGFGDACGTLNNPSPGRIQLVRGGLDNGATGDQLTAFVQWAGIWDDYVTNTQNFDWESYTCFQMGVDDTAATGTPILGAAQYVGVTGVGRGAQLDNENRPFVYVNPTSETWFVLPVVAQDSGGPTVKSEDGFDYQSWQQYILWADACNITLKEQGGDNSTYSGAVGMTTSLSSDLLQPVAQDTTNDQGEPLPTPQSYPVQIRNPTMNSMYTPLPTPATPTPSPVPVDPAQCNIQGVAYGPPPTALNGWEWGDAAGEVWAPQLVFGTDSDSDSETGYSETGGASAGFKVHGVGYKFSGSVASEVTDSSVTTKSYSNSQTWSIDAPQSETYAQYGTVYGTQPVFEFQRFQRMDWAGDVLNGQIMSVFNCVTQGTTLPQSTFPFLMTAPGTVDPNGIAVMNAALAGMTSAPATDDVDSWQTRGDPPTLAGSNGSVITTPAGGDVKVDLDESAGGADSGSEFTESTATTTTKEPSVSESVEGQVEWLTSSEDYGFTWVNGNTSSNGTTLQCDWGVPAQAVVVPDVQGMAGQAGVTALASAGFAVGVEYESISNTGNILGNSQNPAPGSYLAAGAAVNVTVDGTPALFPITVPPPATVPADVSSMSLEGYWMQADNSSAYWIANCWNQPWNGQSQTPWCVDWYVASVTPGASSSSSATARAAVPRHCVVKVRCRPVAGGSASVLGGGGSWAEAGAGGVLAAATAADGYRFVGWRLQGSKVARLLDKDRRKARLVPKLAGGLVTATARFKRIDPRSVSMRLRGRDLADVTVTRAALSRSCRGPRVGGEPVVIAVGDSIYSVPSAKWRRLGGGLHRAVFSPRRWRSKGARAVVTLDTRHHRWSLQARGVRGIGRLVQGAAAGMVPVTVRTAGRSLSFSTVPVACSARFAARRRSAPSRWVEPSPRRLPIDLRRATLSARVARSDYRKSSLHLDGVRVDPDLLLRRGFALSLNGVTVPIGRASWDGEQFVARGRTHDKIRITCRWDANGALSLALAGGYIERNLATFVGHNVVLGIGLDGDEETGVMATQPTRLASLRLAPQVAHRLGM
jgi:hypothetical protein